MKKIVIFCSILLFISGCTTNTVQQQENVSPPLQSKSSENLENPGEEYPNVVITTNWGNLSTFGYSKIEMDQALVFLENYSESSFSNKNFLLGTYNNYTLEREIGPYFSPELQTYITNIDIEANNVDAIRDANALAVFLKKEEESEFFLSPRRPIILTLDNAVFSKELETESLKVTYRSISDIPVRTVENDDAHVVFTHDITVWMQREGNDWVIIGHLANWSLNSPTLDNS